MTISFTDIEKAAKRLAGHIISTPFIYAGRLSELAGCEIFIKLENLQHTNSFKERGALNLLLQLKTADQKRGVIALSAGNHAQAVAYHAKMLDIPTTIVMPQNTPFNKVERTRAHGAKVILSGETVIESMAKVEEIIAAENLTLIHPYNDPQVIAGQGTIAMEMLSERPEIDMMLVPVGGGGLMSGMALAAKTIKPDIEVVGVEASLYPAMYHALRDEQAKCGGSTLAEGIAVKVPGTLCKQLCQRYGDGIRLVSEANIEYAIHALLNEQKLVSEGAGAVGLAAILATPDHFRGRKIGLVLTGGNIDTRILASVIYRELGREQRIVTMRFQIDDSPGILGHIASLLGEMGANILEVSHRRTLLDVPAKGAELEIMIETRDGEHVEEIITVIEAQGYVTKILNVSSV